MSAVNPLLAGSEGAMSAARDSRPSAVHSAVHSAAQPVLSSAGAGASWSSAGISQQPVHSTRRSAADMIEELMPGIMRAPASGPPPPGVCRTLWEEDIRHRQGQARAERLRCLANELDRLATHAMLKDDHEYMQLLMHVRTCTLKDCSYPACAPSRNILAHYRRCSLDNCVVCAPTRENTKRITDLRARTSASRQMAGGGPQVAAHLPAQAAAARVPAPQRAISAVQTPAPQPHKQLDAAQMIAMQLVRQSGQSVQATPAPVSATVTAAAGGVVSAFSSASAATSRSSQPAAMASDPTFAFAQQLVNSFGSKPTMAPTGGSGFSAPTQVPAGRDPVSNTASRSTTVATAQSGPRPPAGSEGMALPAAPPAPAQIVQQQQQQQQQAGAETHSLLTSAEVARRSRYVVTDVSAQAMEAATVPSGDKVVKNKLDSHYCHLYQLDYETMLKHKQSLKSFNPLFSPSRIRTLFRDTVKSLIDDDSRGYFSVAVDPVLHACPDYFTVIKRPMDLSKIKAQLEGGRYHTLEAVVDDVNLVWRNACTYNPVGHEVHTAALALKSIADKKLLKVVNNVRKKLQATQKSTPLTVCSLCQGTSMRFEPPTIFCNGCDKRIRRDGQYHTDTQHRYHWCTTCFRESKDPIVLDGKSFPKSSLNKEKHSNHAEEPWVCCDNCKKWQHQVCALFNGARGAAAAESGVDMQYYCCDCVLTELKKRDRKDAPCRDKAPTASELPANRLDRHVETCCNEMLRRKWSQRMDSAPLSAAAGAGGDSGSSSSKPPTVTVRMLACNMRDYAVGEKFCKRYDGTHADGAQPYPKVLPYRSKALYVFENIDGADVLLFAMYLQEYGDECPQPNHRTAYLAYLDSVKYFSVPWLRTELYKELLISYMLWLRRSGFNSLLIWACPPKEGDDYILFCHPEEQRTPKDKRLQKWYMEVVKEAQERRIAHRVVHLADDFFPSHKGQEGGIDRPLWQLPNYEGDYWPRQAESEAATLAEEAAREGKPLLPGREQPTSLSGGAHSSSPAAQRKTWVLSPKLLESLCSRSSQPSGPLEHSPRPGGAWERRRLVLLALASAECTRYEEERRRKAMELWRAGTTGKLSPEEIATRAKSKAKGSQSKKKRGKTGKAKPAAKVPPRGVGGKVLQEDPLRDKVFEMLTQSSIMHTGFFVIKLRPACQIFKTYILPDEQFYEYVGAGSAQLAGSSGTGALLGAAKKDKSLKDPLKLFMQSQLGVCNLSMRAWEMPDADLVAALGAHPLAESFRREDWVCHMPLSEQNKNKCDMPLKQHIAKFNSAKGFKEKCDASNSPSPAQLAALQKLLLRREAEAKQASEIEMPELREDEAAMVASFSALPLSQLKSKVAAAKKRVRLYEMATKLLKGSKYMLADQDADVDHGFFGTRQLFLDLCRGNHYQFDQLRRAKHSSMMILYHTFNRQAPSFVYHCNNCGNHIVRDEEAGLDGLRWSCMECEEYDICERCKAKRVHNQDHLLVPFSTIGTLADMSEGRDDALVGQTLDTAAGLAPVTDEEVQAALRSGCSRATAHCRALQLLTHTSSCTAGAACTVQGCQAMRRLLDLWMMQVKGGTGYSAEGTDSFGDIALLSCSDDGDHMSQEFLTMWNLVKLHVAEHGVGGTADSQPCTVPFCDALRAAQVRRKEAALRAVRGSVARRGGEGMGPDANAMAQSDDPPAGQGSSPSVPTAAGAPDEVPQSSPERRGRGLTVPPNVLSKVVALLLRFKPMQCFPQYKLRAMAKSACQYNLFVSGASTSRQETSRLLQETAKRESATAEATLIRALSKRGALDEGSLKRQGIPPQVLSVISRAQAWNVVMLSAQKASSPSPRVGGVKRGLPASSAAPQQDTSRPRTDTTGVAGLPAIPMRSTAQSLPAVPMRSAPAGLPSVPLRAPKASGPAPPAAQAASHPGGQNKSLRYEPGLASQRTERSGGAGSGQSPDTQARPPRPRSRSPPPRHSG